MSTTITPPNTEWKPIPGYPGYYANKNGQISLKNKFEPQSLINSHGYKVAQLSIDGKPYRVRAHRLIALAFLGDRSKNDQVNHKNITCDDNTLENLEWTDPKQNMRHFFDELKKYGMKLKPQKLGAYNPSTGEFQQWPSMSQAARFFNVEDSTMCGHAIDYHGGKRLYKGWQLFKLDDDWNVCDSPYPMKEQLKIKAAAEGINVLTQAC